LPERFIKNPTFPAKMDLLIRQKGIDKADRIQLVIAYVLQIILLLTITYALLQRNYLSAFATFGILFLTFLPAIIRKKFRVYIPVELEVIAVVFIFAAVFLGEIHAYYTKFWWWDAILHTVSGFLIGLGGFMLVYILNEEEKVHLKMRPGFVAIFAFAFALAIGSLWEILEFTLDNTLGTAMQKSGLIDTMWDLIVDGLGAAVIAILGYVYLKTQKSYFIDRIIRRLIRKNPHIFRTRRFFRKRSLNK
jgi:hypothetical protein